MEERIGKVEEFKRLLVLTEQSVKIYFDHILRAIEIERELLEENGENYVKNFDYDEKLKILWDLEKKLKGLNWHIHEYAR